MYLYINFLQNHSIKTYKKEILTFIGIVLICGYFSFLKTCFLGRTWHAEYLHYTFSEKLFSTLLSLWEEVTSVCHIIYLFWKMIRLYMTTYVRHEKINTLWKRWEKFFQIDTTMRVYIISIQNSALQIMVRINFNLMWGSVPFN